MEISFLFNTYNLFPNINELTMGYISPPIKFAFINFESGALKFAMYISEIEFNVKLLPTIFILIKFSSTFIQYIDIITGRYCQFAGIGQ